MIKNPNLKLSEGFKENSMEAESTTLNFLSGLATPKLPTTFEVNTSSLSIGYHKFVVNIDNKEYVRTPTIGTK